MLVAIVEPYTTTKPCSVLIFWPESRHTLVDSVVVLLCFLQPRLRMLICVKSDDGSEVVTKSRRQILHIWH